MVIYPRGVKIPPREYIYSIIYTRKRSINTQ